jgi:lipopolysaccharide transport system ATP-binding protein
MKPIILASNLCKMYRLGSAGPRYATLRETLMGSTQSLLKRPKRNIDALDESVWALKDVSFEVQAGEVIGIIGRNGAGKSTLLKVLSRITEPTSGRVELYGRVGSLLEIGTGFHPELTGRENIYLNGAMLGMKRAEIARKFDEIVAFAEIEKFLDTPVKRYSSGMYMRLAFAVAAHLEPEILVIDEVLAVGDIAFQRKCLGKMQDVATEGRTVLFVSHNMAAVSNLCQTSLVLDSGEVLFRGSAVEGISRYTHINVAQINNADLMSLPRKGAGGIRLTKMELSCNGEKILNHRCGSPLEIAFNFTMSNEVDTSDISIQVRFVDDYGITVLTLWNKTTEQHRSICRKSGWLTFSIDRLPLRPGLYRLSVWLKSDRGLEDWLDGVIPFEVLEGDFFGTGRLPPKDTGTVFVDHQFSIKHDDHSNEKTPYDGLNT